jgi:hypothetical protein
MINRIIRGFYQLTYKFTVYLEAYINQAWTPQGLFNVVETESDHDLMCTGVVMFQIGKGDVV